MVEAEELLATFRRLEDRETILRFLEAAPVRGGRRRDLFTRWALGVGVPVTAEDLRRLDPAFTPILPNR